MIIRAGRQTDIPSCYSVWFFRRPECGFARTRNPMNPKQVNRSSRAPSKGLSRSVPAPFHSFSMV